MLRGGLRSRQPDDHGINLDSMPEIGLTESMSVVSWGNDRIRMTRVKLLLLLLGAGALAIAEGVWAFSSDAEQRIRASGIVSEGVIDGLRSKGLVRVMIAFRAPGEKQTQARGKMLSRNRSLIASTGESILGRLKPGQFELRHRFETIGALAGRVTANGVLELVNHPSPSFRRRLSIFVRGRASVKFPRPGASMSTRRTSG